MTRLLAAALLLALAAAPAFACPYDSVSTDDQSKTVAAQPTNDPPAQPATPSKDKAPS